MEKKRIINIDLVKTVAVISVISVHFFANTGFYDKSITGIDTYLMVFFRTLFMICVPLFMITTGYLMKNKKISKKYYIGIFRVLITYLLIALMYIFYHCFYLKEASFSIKYIISSILRFDIGYRWYIEMYIGMFLIIPFINLIYNNLNTKKQKHELILTMLILTALPGLLNAKYSLIADWWINLYPITYYFIGCYINEYKPKIGKFKNILILLITLIISTFTNLILSNGTTFVRDVHNDWGSIFNVLTSVLTFILIINLNLDNVNKNLSKLITKISELSLGMYLASSIVDNYIYFNVLDKFSSCNFITYIIKVPIVVILSLVIALFVNLLYKIINKYLIEKIINRFYNV